jgi:hypothetical protein
MQEKENAYYSKKVGDYFERFTTGLKNITKLKDSKFKNCMGNMWLQHHKKSVQTSNLPDIVKSYLCNIYHAFYREKILRSEK